MVQSMDDLDFRLPSHAQDMLDGLRRLRALPKLADVTLLVGGRELRCHRGLLALSSPYFHAMFAGDFAESLSARVELRDVDPDVVEQLVDFAYTGRLRVTRGTAEGLARGASRLHFPAVQKVCGRYLQQQLDAANCLGLCEFGERQGLPGVAAKARAFLRENFEAVARGDEFLRLPPERLAACLAGELLQARPGQSRLAALLRWARHDPRARAAHLPGLLRLLPPDAVPGPCVRRLLATEPLIRGSEACREALARGRSAVPPGLPQELQEVLVVVGGQALEEEDEGGGEPAAPLGNFAFYNTKTRRWMALPDFPDYHKWGFSLAALNNDVYVTGGSRGTKTDTWSTTQAWCFLLKEAAWKPVAPMPKARTNHASTALNGEIYVIGGTTLDVVEMESYDPYTDSWTVLSPALKYVSNFSAASCQGRLYLVGSSACKYNALALQCYNPVTDVWNVITSPFLPKYLSSPRCASLKGALYLIGDNTKKMYVYDPGANLWQKVQSQHSLHENGGLVALGDALYVTGGRWQDMGVVYRVEMEAYDTVRDAWARHGALPRLWLYHGAAAIFLDLSTWTRRFPSSWER
ncbi:kelch-like protein 30 isoform X2 [Perognathus longimembris pacificus]|uniref:kelch-like protein 30 isoform X2 n=1 Tax=Perognathus longimembris pacificus TaxID=214514 RepID=UPI0020196B5D|nr:kelch-like protein 30 isoform X2 [Perognathus longimembris pacificus]